MTTQDPGIFIEQLREIERAIPRAIEEQTFVAAREADKIAVDLLSGRTSSRELAIAGHPFAKAHPARGFPRLPINIQSGDLIASRRFEYFHRGTGVYGWRFYFVSEHAKYVLAPKGTNTMVPRGYWQEMRKRLAARLALGAVEFKYSLRRRTRQ